MFKAICLAAVVGFTVVPAAEAAIVTIDVTGTIDYGYDLTGIFGAVDSSLTGQTANLKLVFDTSKGLRTTTVTNDTLVGDPSIEATFGNPFVSSSVTVNGLTHAFATASRFGADLEQPSTGSESTVQAQEPTVLAGIYNGVFMSQIWDLFSNVPAGLESSFSYDPAMGPSNAGFEIAQINSAQDGLDVFTYGSLSSIRGTYTVTGVEPPVSAVPLPASLPLLLAGIAALAGWKRRLRRLAA